MQIYVNNNNEMKNSIKWNLSGDNIFKVQRLLNQNLRR